MTNFYNNFAEQLPVVKDILNQFDEIKSELFNFIKTGKAFKKYDQYIYHDPHTGETKQQLYDNDWSVFGIARFDWDGIEKSQHTALKNEETNRIIKLVQRYCKITSAIIKPYEQKKLLWNGFVSRLTPGSIIHPHRGWNNSVLRVHVCLQDDKKCFMTVNNETQTWKEKKVLAFVDFDIHSVKHQGDRDRIIMSFDVPFDYVEQCCPGFIKKRNGV